MNNTQRKTIRISIYYLSVLFLSLCLWSCSMEKQPLSGEQEKLFRQPEELSKQSFIKPIKIKNRILHKYNVSGYPYQNISFEGNDIYNFRFNSSTLTNVSFEKGELTGIFFNDANLVSVTFENLTITDGTFIDTKFGNVVFKNCTLNNPAFGGAKGKIKFIHSTLNAPDFYQAQAILDFESSTITNQTNPQEEIFRAQKLPAAIYLKDSHILGESNSGPIIVGGTLTAFKASGGSLVNVGIGDNIKEVELRHTTLDISTGGNIDILLVDQSQITRLGIGDTRINQITLSDCQTPVNLLSLIDGKFQHLDITNCTIRKFEPWSASGAYVDIRNSTLVDANFQDAKLGELLLKNVTIQNINLKNAHANKFTSDRVTLSVNAQVQDAGSNIKLH